MDAKEYYRTGKHSVWRNSEMRQDLLQRISNSPGKTVFEFGCGQGENLNVLKKMGFKVFGLDINEEECAKCYEKHGFHVNCGDETLLDLYQDNAFDVSFTCGVLDHIPNIKPVVENLKRITKDIILCLETQDTPASYYYPHYYHDLGFKFVTQFATDNGIYQLWSLKC